MRGFSFYLLWRFPGVPYFTVLSKACQPERAVSLIVNFFRILQIFLLLIFSFFSIFLKQLFSNTLVIS